jgi:cation-transporting ATPase E
VTVLTGLGEKGVALDGLSDADVRQRVEAGKVNRAPAGSGRSVLGIVRDNLLTRFNAILGSLLVVIVVIGPWQDMLFGVVLVANAAIGIIQELRAKVVLDRLTLLATPRVRAWRGGSPAEVRSDELVTDDVIEVGPGDQVPVDGIVLDGELELDESMLTGESDAVVKPPGEIALSGSLVVGGGARLRALAVGDAAYAQRLAAQARQFRLARSELRSGIDRILRLVTWAMVPAGAMLVSSQLAGTDLRDALRGSVAGVGSMVPEGLVLLTSMAFAAAVIRLARRQALVRELGAVEVLARVDVVCVDKTGTLTDGEAELTAVVRAERAGATEAETAEALGALAGADPRPNATLRAIARAYPAPEGWPVAARIPFASSRRWSATDFGPRGVWLLGAPEVLLAASHDGPDQAMASTLATEVGLGSRVVLLAKAPAGRALTPELPGDATPAALVVLKERVRPDVAETLAYFADQGVAVKVISGDNPRTVAAVAERSGLARVGDPVDAQDLPEDQRELAGALATHNVFGRVAPDQKRAMVRALQQAGHVVAMTGDGVNDVLALKDADLGVAMGSGSAATRAVGKVVLLSDQFSALPGVVAEGRRVIANIERVGNLFVTKTVYALCLAVAVSLARLPFPFLPRHLTIVSSLTIGIPGFFLALSPDRARARPGFVGRVLRFAVPTGVVAAGATLAAYALARDQPGLPLVQARTTATVVLFGVAFWVLAILARPITGPRLGLMVGLVTAFGAVMALPGMRHFYSLRLPPLLLSLAAIGIIAIAVALLESGWRVVAWVRLHHGRMWPPGRLARTAVEGLRHRSPA